MNCYGRRQKLENHEPVRKKRQSENPKQKNWHGETCACPMAKSIRTFEFLAVLLLLALLIYITAMNNTSLTDITLILLLILAAAYLFIIVIDIISQFGGDAIPDTPMLVLSVIGALLFSIAAIPIFFRLTTQRKDGNISWIVTTIFALCLVITALFLIDVTTIIAYWRQRLTALRKCCPHVTTGGCDDTKTLFLRSDARSPANAEVGKCELTTSISNCRQPLDIDDATCHVYRKIGFGCRRQYIDTTTGVPSTAAMYAAQVQTDPGKVTITECQTLRQEIKEAPMQTSSRCEFCDCRLNQPPTCPTHCALCPATIVHLVRDGTGPSCCTACKCDNGGSTKTQAQLQLQLAKRSCVDAGTPGTMMNLVVGDRRGSPVKKFPRAYETRPCPTHGAGLAARIAGLPETVTRVTLAPYCIRKNKRTQTPSVPNKSTTECRTTAESEPAAKSEGREEEKSRVVESAEKKMNESVCRKSAKKDKVEDASMTNVIIAKSKRGDEKMERIEGADRTKGQVERENLRQTEVKIVKRKANVGEVEERKKLTAECVSPNEGPRNLLRREYLSAIQQSSSKSECPRKKEGTMRRTDILQRKHKVEPAKTKESHVDPKIIKHGVTLRTKNTITQMSQTRIFDARQTENIWNTACVDFHTKQALSSNPSTVKKTDAFTMTHHPQESTMSDGTQIAASSSLHSAQLERSRSRCEKADFSQSLSGSKKSDSPAEEKSSNKNCSRSGEKRQKTRTELTDTITRWRPNKSLHKTCHLT